MKLIRISDSVVIAPEHFSWYEARESSLSDHAQVIGHPLSGCSVVLASFLISAANGWSSGALALAQAELARIQALVEKQ